MAVIIFTAPCPECGGDARWQQATGSGYRVAPDDFTIRCGICDVPAVEEAA